jgi:hypothetical protein
MVKKNKKYLQRRYYLTTTLDWFLKSIVPLLAKEFYTTFPQIEDKAIIEAQNFD